jgi:hypothetical protein
MARRSSSWVLSVEAWLEIGLLFRIKTSCWDSWSDMGIGRVLRGLERRV